MSFWELVWSIIVTFYNLYKIQVAKSAGDQDGVLSVKKEVNRTCLYLLLEMAMEMQIIVMIPCVMHSVKGAFFEDIHYHATVADSVILTFVQLVLETVTNGSIIFIVFLFDLSRGWGEGKGIKFTSGDYGLPILLFFIILAPFVRLHDHHPISSFNSTNMTNSTNSSFARAR
jgi:hypothetical protein